MKSTSTRLGFTIVTSLMMASQIYAGNGANLIGLTPNSSGRGGVGIGTFVGVESLTKNPAMLSEAKEYESVYGANFVALDAQSRIQAGGSDSGFVKSQTSKFVVPEMGFIKPISDKVTLGLGIFGTAGFGVDYRNSDPSLSNSRFYLMSLKAVPGISYKMGKFSAGASLHLGFGLLDLAGVLPSDPTDFDTYQQRSGGVGESFGFGYQLGAKYDVCKYATLGVTYQSDLAYKFKRAFDFNLDNTYDDFNVTMPKELGLGVSSKVGKWELSADLKQVYWSEAEGFKQFRWQDQTVYGLGAQYDVIPKKLNVRFGYNYSPSVVKPRSDLSIANGTFPLGTGTFLDSNIAYFDAVGLGPIVAGESFTVGAGYRITQHVMLNGSLEYILTRRVTQSGQTTTATPDDTSVVYTSKSSGMIVGASLSWMF